MDTQTALLTDGEAARAIRMPRARLVRLAKAGQAPSVQLPDGEIRFVEADLWAWVEEHKQNANPNEDDLPQTDCATRFRQ